LEYDIVQKHKPAKMIFVSVGSDIECISFIYWNLY